MGSAMVAVGAATGTRAWVAAKAPPWMTPSRLKAFTALLLGGAVLASGISPS